MPASHIWLRKELRLLGAIQLMIFLTLQSLGYFWTFLFFTQSVVFGAGTEFFPIIASSGYALWSSFSFCLSGCSSIMLQKKPSSNLAIWSLVANIISICVATIGVFLLSLELTLTSNLETSLWQHRSGRMLSEYMFVFSILEIFVAALATEWIYQAKYGH